MHAGLQTFDFHRKPDRRWVRLRSRDAVSTGPRGAGIGQRYLGIGWLDIYNKKLHVTKDIQCADRDLFGFPYRAPVLLAAS